MDCKKHPLIYKNYSPEDFKKEFEKWSFNFQKDFLKELSFEYLRQSKGDRKRGRLQLANNLKVLSEVINLQINLIKPKEGTISFKNPKDLAKEFGYTNYFYQELVFKEINKSSFYDFNEIIKAIEAVCKVCKKHMEIYN